MLYCGTANTLSKLGGNTTTTRKFLRSVATTSGTATAPAWDTLVAGDLPIATSSAVGGVSVSTGLGVSAAGAVTVTYGTAAGAALASSGSAGSANSASRSDHTHPFPAITSCTGTLTVAKGGTNLTSITQGGILYAASTTAYGCTVAGTAGQLIISNGTNAPSWAEGLTYVSNINDATKQRYISFGACNLLSLETASSGYAQLELGNNIADGSAFSAYGELKLYNKSSGYHYLNATGTGTSYYTHTLPEQTGVLVTTNNTSGAVGSSTKPVYVSANGVLAEGEDISKIVMVKHYSYKITSSIAAGTATSVSNTNLGMSTPTGYKLAGILEAWTSETAVGIHYFAPIGAPAATVRVRNFSGSNAYSNVTVHIRALYIKTTNGTVE